MSSFFKKHNKWILSFAGKLPCSQGSGTNFCETHQENLNDQLGSLKIRFEYWLLHPVNTTIKIRQIILWKYVLGSSSVFILGSRLASFKIYNPITRN